jgi:predicted RNase H-like HicB family nuclease
VVEITVPELESGQVTQARTLDDAEATARDLIALMAGAEPDRATLIVSGGYA